MDIKNKIMEDTFLKEKDIIIPKNNLVAYDLPTSTYVDTRIFSRLLEDSRVVASYKMYWLLGILEEVSLGNSEITFRKLISRMIVGSWYPIMQYKLYFGQFDNLAKGVKYISSVYNKHSNINSNELLDFIYNSNDKTLNKQMKELSYNVPYMLLSPFFDEKIKGLKSPNRVKRIIELSLSEPNVLYKIIIDKENKVVIDDEWARYMAANYRIIKSWIYYKLSCFLQKRNPNVPSIIFKLDPPKYRDLSHATKLWIDIINNRDVKDIYTGNEFSAENYKELGTLSIDHFIPWSFVLHDEIWNLVPTFKNINSRKNDKLLRYENYIDDYCNTQFEAFSFICDKKRNKDLESYVDLLRLENPLDFYKYRGREGFNEKLRTSIAPIYQIAVNQGFSVIDSIDK